MSKILEEFLHAKSPIKIFVSYHKKFIKTCSEIVIPMHIGRAIAKKPAYDGVIKNNEYKWLINNTIGDDTGDNISSENRRYCELTAQYWVWKHLEEFKGTDYIGFMHYRRQFLFNDKIPTKNRTLWYLSIPDMFCINSFRRLISYLNLNKKDIYKEVLGYDCVILKPFDVTNINSKSVKERFRFLVKPKAERLDVLEKTVKEMYPEYSDAVEKVLNGNMQVLCNMYIMKKELFKEYAQFLFNILSKLDKEFDYSENETPNTMRSIGYMGEVILTIFIMQKKHNLKINCLKGLLYGDGSIIRVLKLLKLCLLTKFN